MGVGSLSVLTLVLVALHPRIGLPSVFLLYLTGIVGISLVGGTWPALISAAAALVLINWFFTPPTHTLTIAGPENVLGLGVFLLVAVVVSVLVDREARARADAQRRRHEADSLERVNELKTAILAAASHDLRTPLASIKASASSLRQPDVVWSPEETDEFLTAIEEGADQLTSLVGNLLDMSRIQTGSVVLAPATLGLDEIVPRALASMPSSDMQVDVPETLPRVSVDGDLLERAIANVVSNARQWSPLGSPVLVFARSLDARVELHIIDHGPGVPAEERARMFMPFQRLGDRPGGEGIGLGLAVALGFVEAMDGTIEAKDTPGGGLTVVMCFEVAS
ncbi:MAG: PAS domain-containing sensor histidine kinase [Actinomycetota bacterium]|nr:PAS domain-containing sensor histidine kinase [Actinomycetota bacterium]